MSCVSNSGPGWLDKVSFIIRYAVDTCSTPWEVYLQTGGKALGNLSMTMLFIDTADLARSFFRPKKSRSGRHSAPWLGRGKKRIQKGIFPELADVIADTTRSATDLQKPKYSDGFNHIWAVDTHLQKVLNKVLFVNMATDFAYDWFSGIMLSPESNCGNGRFSCAYEAGPFNSNDWRLTNKLGAPQYAKNALCGANQVVIEDGLWAISYAARVTPLSGEEGDLFQFLHMVGPEETMAPCGKMLELKNKGPGKFDEDEHWTTVQGPAIVRIIAKAPGWDGGVAWGSVITILRGFRLD